MPETKTKIIDGESFEITWPYVAGHVLNDAEAKALNQVRSENIGNNLRSAVKEAKEKAEKGDANAMTELRTAVAEYDREYTFALGGTPARKLDPVEREARNIANEYLKAEFAKKRITEITAEAEIGKVYEGPVTKILDFGALINILPGKDGLLHISQIAHQRVEKVTDFLSEGQVVKVKVLETDEKGRIKLSMKALLDKPEGYEEPERSERPRREYGDRGDRGPRGDRGDRPRRDRGDRGERRLRLREVVLRLTRPRVHSGGARRDLSCNSQP